MAFLNPLVLFALAAAAIPLLVHLFNFRRARRIEYSSLRFLKELRRSTLQRVRVERWLLLLLRTLAVLCLIAAFSRPVMTGGAFTGDAKVSAAVVVDNSLSMILRDDGGTYMEQARAYARTLAGDADEVFFLSAAAGSVVRGQASVLEAIDAVAPDARAVTALEAVERAAAVLQEEGTHLNKEVYFIGDLQQSTLADTMRRRVPEAVRLTLVPVGGRTHENVAIEDVVVTSRIVEAGEPVRIEATLKSYLAAPVDNYVASLYLGGERLAQQSVALAPGARVRVSFTATPGTRGWLAGHVQVEDDAFAADNKHFFVFHVPETRRVLVVRGSLATVEFVTLALAVGDDVMEVETIESAALSRAVLNSFDAVMLAGLRTLSSGELGAMARYVDEGGGLVLFPSGVSSDVNVLLERLGGGRISGYVVSDRDAVPVATVMGLDAEHPLFEGVFEDISRMEQPAVLRAAVYEPAAGTEQTLLTMSNGRPFLQEIRLGRGLVFVFAVSPDPGWSDLPVRGLFVPLMHRTVHYLAAGESVQGNQLVAGRPEVIRLGNTTGRVRIVTPAGEEVTPKQRQLVGTTVIEAATEYSTPGVYDIMVDSTLVRRMAVNLASRESDLTVVAESQAKDLMTAAAGVPVRVVNAGAQSDLAARMRQDRVGVELWRVFLVLALVFMGLEMVVSTQRRARPA